MSHSEIKLQLLPPIYVFSVADQMTFNEGAFCVLFLLFTNGITEWKMYSDLTTICCLAILKNKILRWKCLFVLPFWVIPRKTWKNNPETEITGKKKTVE